MGGMVTTRKRPAGRFRPVGRKGDLRTVANAIGAGDDAVLIEYDTDTTAHVMLSTAKPVVSKASP